MLSIRKTLSLLALLVGSSFAAPLIASETSSVQTDSPGHVQFNKVNGIHKKIQAAMASVRNGLQPTYFVPCSAEAGSGLTQEITCEQIGKAIASFSELKNNHAAFIEESSKLPNDGQQKLFPLLMEGEYKKGNTEANLKQLAANISEQEQKLIQSLCMSQEQLNKRVAASSDPRGLSMIDSERLTLASNCLKISQGKDFSEQSKATAMKISSELVSLESDIRTKRAQIRAQIEQTQENAALNELTKEYDQLNLVTDCILRSKNPVIEQELTTEINHWATLKSKFQALVLKVERNQSNRTYYISEIGLQSKRLEARIKQQQLDQQNIFQRLARKLTKKQWIVSALVSITAVAGLAYGEHKHKMVSKLIFGQARAPEQIFTQLSWWARTRNWFRGWLSKLTSLNRVRA